MPTARSVIDDARDLVQRRLIDLDEERKRLERALAALGGQAIRRPPGRPRGSKSSSPPATPAARPARARKRRTGTRADQVLKLVESESGIDATKIAKAIKIKPNYVYRVLGDLEKEGRVTKERRKYYPVKVSDAQPPHQSQNDAPPKATPKSGRGRAQSKRSARGRKKSLGSGQKEG